MSRLGLYSEEREKNAAAERAAHRDTVALHDALLDVPEFRRWLGYIADGGGYISDAIPVHVENLWRAGYRAAKREIVKRIVVDSTNGAAWMAEYFQARVKARKEKIGNGNRDE